MAAIAANVPGEAGRTGPPPTVPVSRRRRFPRIARAVSPLAGPEWQRPSERTRGERCHNRPVRSACRDLGDSVNAVFGRADMTDPVTESVGPARVRSAGGVRLQPPRAVAV